MIVTNVVRKIANNPRLWALVVPAVLVSVIYVVLPTVIAWIAALVSGLIAAIPRGPRIFDSPDFHNYLANSERFFGQFVLLVGSGIAALVVWRKEKLRIYGSRTHWLDTLIGVAVGAVTYVCSKQFIVPWLYLARPLGSEWIKNEYITVDSYRIDYVGQVASVFFIDTIYAAFIETVLLVGLLYLNLRKQWGFLVSILFAAILFAAIHRNELFFLDFFLFGLINFGLYEWRKSLAAPFFHHFAFNALIYGSQLALFSGSPTK